MNNSGGIAGRNEQKLWDKMNNSGGTVGWNDQ